MRPITISMSSKSQRFERLFAYSRTQAVIYGFLYIFCNRQNEDFRAIICAYISIYLYIYIYRLLIYIYRYMLVLVRRV